MTRILKLQQLTADNFEKIGVDEQDMVSGCSYVGCVDCSSCSGSGCSTFGGNFIA